MRASMSSGKAFGSMLAILVAMALTASSASAQTPIGPDQRFAGVINGSAEDAVVYVVCQGPADLGHPLADQGVQVVENTGRGLTGSAASIRLAPE